MVPRRGGKKLLQSLTKSQQSPAAGQKYRNYWAEPGQLVDPSWHYSQFNCCLATSTERHFPPPPPAQWQRGRRARPPTLPAKSTGPAVATRTPSLVISKTQHNALYGQPQDTQKPQSNTVVVKQFIFISKNVPRANPREKGFWRARETGTDFTSWMPLSAPSWLTNPTLIYLFVLICFNA